MVKLDGGHRLAEEHDLILYEQLMQVARASALQEITRDIAHEINQPLGAIATFAQTGKRMLSRQTPLVDAAINVLEQISTQALSAGEGIHRIRASFTKPDNVRVDCDPARLLLEVRPILDVLAAREGVSLEFNCEAGLPRVKVDPVLIQYVLLVLAQNAIEATRESPDPRVHVAAVRDAYSVLVSVDDVGCGVPSDFRDKLFHAFFTTKANGAGLGLAAAHGIVDAHGGKMGYEDVGGGSRFWFTVPFEC